MLSIEEASRAIARGIDLSNKEYLNWSGGLCIHDHGVEHLMSAQIARSLYKVGKGKQGYCYVTLETSFAEILHQDGAKPRGRPPKNYKPGSRCDVVYYDGGGFPRGVVEAKRWFGYSIQKNDLERIALLLRKSQHLKWGAVASIRQYYDSQRIHPRDVLERFIYKSASQFPAYDIHPIHKRTKAEPEELGWGTFMGYDAIGILIEKK